MKTQWCAFSNSQFEFGSPPSRQNYHRAHAGNPFRLGSNPLVSKAAWLLLPVVKVFWLWFNRSSLKWLFVLQPWTSSVYCPWWYQVRITHRDCMLSIAPCALILTPNSPCADLWKFHLIFRKSSCTNIWLTIEKNCHVVLSHTIELRQ